MGRDVGMWGAAVLILCSGCNVKVDDPDPGSGGSGTLDTGRIKDTIDEAVDEARDLEICPGYTVDELLTADSLSDECRDALLSFLPEPQTSFESRLLAPGGARIVEGELQVLLHAAGADGAAISAADLSAGLEVGLVVGGEERTLARDELTLSAAGELSGELLSIAVVNDYSASMLDADLDDVEQVERALFGCMPAVHETEVIRFSEAVEKVLDFSEDRAAIDAALARDDDFDRGTTALLDGLGSGLTDLSARERPVRLVILATDGRENASTMWQKPEVLEALAQPSVFIVVLGGLLADVGLMKELAETSGVYFYAREFSGLAESVQPYCDSLAELAELRVPLVDGETAEQLHLVHAELSLELTLELDASAQ